MIYLVGLGTLAVVAVVLIVKSVLHGIREGV